MVQTCQRCDSAFDTNPLVNGVRLNLHGRKVCLGCRPHKPHHRTAPPRPRPARIKTCETCGDPFPAKILIAGKVRSLYRRRFCFSCSPFGGHNTSKTPPGNLSPGELKEHRRKRRNANTYRYQKKRRRQLKATLVQALGGRCQDCGYEAYAAALDPHHIDPSTKELALSAYRSEARLLAESAKCVLLCANCHRLRHASEDANAKGGPVVEFRRRMKARAVAFMGLVCSGCGRNGHQAVFEFHHRDPAEKEFGITSDGIPRRWEKIVAELAKCVMLCANCHREVHAGVRGLDDGLLGLAENAGRYAVAVYGSAGIPNDVATAPSRTSLTHSPRTQPRASHSLVQ